VRLGRPSFPDWSSMRRPGRSCGLPKAGREPIADSTLQRVRFASVEIRFPLRGADHAERPEVTELIKLAEKRCCEAYPAALTQPCSAGFLLEHREANELIGCAAAHGLTPHLSCRAGIVSGSLGRHRSRGFCFWNSEKSQRLAGTASLVDSPSWLVRFAPSLLAVEDALDRKPRLASQSTGASCSYVDALISA